MASSIQELTRCMSLLIDSAKVFEAAQKTVEAIDRNDRGSDVEKASLTNRMILLGFTVAEVGLVLSGAESKSLEILKKVEIVPRVLNLPFEIITQSFHLAQSRQTPQDHLRFIQNALLSPTADIVRVAAQGKAYQEQTYLDLDPKELEKATRPIYEERISYDGQYDLEIVGHKPVEIEECLKNLEEANSCASKAAILQLANAIFNPTLPLYERLALYVRQTAHEGLIALAQRIAPQQEQQGQAVENVDFRQLPTIPLPLHQDALFSQFICSITQEPIRDPVRDPTGGNATILYERIAITNWLRINETSPHTRQPLRVENLVECPALKLIIDERLEMHYQGLLLHLGQNANAPIADADQAVINDHL
ncbi:MAG: hypothetical protein COT85_07925 [Chlamydiae bacterium CG10_big_fil_rev_8_21_14_0_10_42_34]|nr:MAG: hypothetical protein COT85_07925 [Chlamydiae bacterium CG10_big_fil_rev_8_21_14_0_10_42_34]